MINTLLNFWAKVDKRGPIQEHMDSRCWVWTGCTDKGGYGNLQPVAVLIALTGFLLATGEEPEVVAHKCTTRTVYVPATLKPEIPHEHARFRQAQIP